MAGRTGAKSGYGYDRKDETPWPVGRTLDQGMGMAGRTDARSGEGLGNYPRAGQRWANKPF